MYQEFVNYNIIKNCVTFVNFKNRLLTYVNIYMGVCRAGQGGTSPHRNGEQGYFLVTRQGLHTIIHKVAIAGYTNENYIPLRAMDFFSKASRFSSHNKCVKNPV